MAMAEQRQLRIAFDHVDLRGMTTTEHANVLTRLALLLLEAAGMQTQEANDEQR
jgi:hypothetical protein